MFKLGLTALVTAAACFAIAAATGFGAAVLKPLTLHVRQAVDFKAGNFHCQVLTANQVVCGADALKNSVQVYFQPHLVAVIKFNKTGTKFTQLYAAKR
jgi:hypothetical protein